MDQFWSLKHEMQSRQGMSEVLKRGLFQAWMASVDLEAARKRLELARRYQEHYDKLDFELANLRISQSWLASQTSQEAHALLFAYIDCLAAYLYQRNLFAELLQWCEDGLRTDGGVHSGSGALWLLKGKALQALGQWNEARNSYQMSIEACEQRDPSLYAQALLAMGQLQFNRGDYTSAFETFAKAEKLFSEQSDYEHLASIQSEKAAYYLNRGDLERALTLYLEADQTRERAGKTDTPNLFMLGVVYRKKKDYQRAALYLHQLLEEGEKHRQQSTIATASHHLAWIAFDQGDQAQARSLCGRALTLYEEFGDTRGSSDAYEQLGRIALAEGNNLEAVSCLQLSLSIRQKIGNQQGTASSLSHLAIAYLRMGQVAKAIWYLWQCLRTYQRIGMLSRQRFLSLFQKFFQAI